MMKKNNSIANWQAAKKLFEKYIDQPTTLVINEINADDDIPALVKSKLLKLIKSQSKSDTIIDNPELSFFGPINTLQEDLSGKKIGEYKLVSRIGSGGMSNVYKAKRLDTKIQKFVALKLINTLDNEVAASLKSLFEAEQVILSKLNHPNIISFHHGGISQSGIPFLVMDFIEDAQDIQEYVNSHTFTTKQIVKLIQQVADAISYAHQNFIIHKDIKPNNILIDRHGNPKVVDFGISTILVEEQKHQQTIYTPDYASPEQIMDNHIAPNSDVFSLCAVLLELLTQLKPFPDFEIGNYQSGEDTKHVDDLLAQTTIKTDLKNIIKTGLTIDPKLRYQTMSEFNQELEHWLNNKPIKATHNTTLYLLSKFIQRHLLTSLAVVSLLVSIIIGITLIIQEKNQARFEAKKAQQVTDFLIDSIQASDPDLTKGKEVSVIELLQNAKIKIQEGSFDDVHLEATLKTTIGSALVKAGEYQDAEKLLSQAVKSNPNNFKSHVSLAQLYLQQKQFDKAQQQLKILTVNQSNLSVSENIQTIQIQAEILHVNGQFTQAIKKINQAINIQKATPKEQIKSKLALAKILNDSDKYDQSIKILKDALDISKSQFGEISTSSTNISMLLASTLSSIDDIPQGEIYNLYTQTITNQTILFNKNHPIIAKSYLQYGFALKAFGETDKALESALKAKKIALTNYDENHILSAHISLLISQIKIIKGDINEAIIQLSKVLKVYATHYGENHFETNQTKTTLAFFLLKANKAQEALDMLLPLYKHQKQQLGEFNKATFYVKLNIIKAKNLLGHHQEALSDNIITLANSRKHLGKESILSIGYQLELAKSQLHNKKYKKVVELCNELLTFDLIKNHKGYNKRVSELLTQAQEGL